MYLTSSRFWVLGVELFGFANGLQTVDWTNGRAVIGDDESEILRMVRQLPKN